MPTCRALVAEPKLLDQSPVAVEICPLHVVEEAATLADHLEQAAATVVVLRMSAEVLGEVVDALAEQGDLESGRTGVGLV